MPQFGVFRNPGRNTEIPYLLQVQSTRYDRRTGRVVLPLVRVSSSAPPDTPMTPHLQVQGISVYANPFEITTVPLHRLGEALEVLPEPDEQRIIRAIDEMISRA